jgi:hypothetical protein
VWCEGEVTACQEANVWTVTYADGTTEDLARADATAAVAAAAEASSAAMETADMDTVRASAAEDATPESGESNGAAADGAATGEGGAAAAPEGGAGGTKRKAGSGRPAGLDEAQLEALAQIVAQGEAPTGDKIVEAFLASAPGRSKAAANRALREIAASPGGRGKWLLTRDACGKFGLPFVAPPAQAAEKKAPKVPKLAAAAATPVAPLAAGNSPVAERAARGKSPQQPHTLDGFFRTAKYPERPSGTAAAADAADAVAAEPAAALFAAPAVGAAEPMEETDGACSQE